jgi:glycosyltransferase involved in cell wall biosynthesis
MPKKKILFVIGSLGRGGAEHQMVMLIGGLVHRGWKCKVFVLDDTGPLRACLREIGVPTHNVEFAGKTTRIGSVLTVLRAPLHLAWIAIRWRPDVMHAYLPLTNVIGAVAGRLAFVPLVITSRRALGTHQNCRPYWPLFDRMANTLSSVVTCNSLAVGLDTIRRDGIDRAKLVLIRNGLAFDEFDDIGDREAIRAGFGVDRGVVAIATVGNLIPYKGHSDLLDAIARLRPDAPAPKIFLIGRDDGIGAELKEKARQLGIGENVVFLGARNDVPRLLSAMDLFVLPSHEEGSSNALLEAMATGLPIVATDVGGNAEALDNGRLGTLVPPRDPTALASAIEMLLDDMETGTVRAREAAKYVRANYSADSMVRSHIMLYHGDRSYSLLNLKRA